MGALSAIWLQVAPIDVYKLNIIIVLGKSDRRSKSGHFDTVYKGRNCYERNEYSRHQKHSIKGNITVSIMDCAFTLLVFDY